MAVVVTCPACQRKARVPDAAVGKSVRCPGCGNTFPAVSADASPPFNDSTDLADEPERTASPDEDARRVTRAGVGLLAVSQALLACAAGIRLLLALVRLVVWNTDSSYQESFTEFVIVVSSLALLGGIAAALIGGTFCAIPPGPLSVRLPAAAVLILSALVAIQGPAVPEPFAGPARGWARLPDFPSGFAGLALMATLTSEVYECARQAMLAVFARSQARRHADRAAAGLAGLLAVGYPAVVIGLILLGIAVTLFSGKPHPTFAQVLSVLVLLAKTVLVALGAFVLLRVWLRLGTERP